MVRARTMWYRCTVHVVYSCCSRDALYSYIVSCRCTMFERTILFTARIASVSDTIFEPEIKYDRVAILSDRHNDFSFLSEQLETKFSFSVGWPWDGFRVIVFW